MTTTIQQFKNWIAKEEGILSADFSSAESALVDYFGPLFKQILTQAETVGKGDIQAGLKVLTDAVTTSVAAGATAIAAGQDPVAAAEAQFVSTTVSEGITAVNNAEAGLIKAGVAAAQEIETAIPGAVAAVESVVVPVTGN